jgi:hypothetical protein
MRCPKCGYISFDHMEQCLKCKKSIKTVSDNLRGTIFHAATPTFLQFDRQTESEKDDEFIDQLDAEEEFVDEDLEILVAEDNASADDRGGATDSRDSAAVMKGTGDSADIDEEEDREIEIDLSQFEDIEAPELAPAASRQVEGVKEDRQVVLEMPAELEDISDLAPPKRTARGDKDAPGKSAAKDTPDPPIDDLDFDLGLDDLDNDFAPASIPAGETVLALDDLDFSETLTGKSSPTSAQRADSTDMDADLNFDLDLGGLSIHKDQ